MNNQQLQRFFAKVATNPDTGCWEWTAGRWWDGYPRFRLANKSCRAHRVSYEHFVGALPPGGPGCKLQVDHICRVRHCVNPWHLRIVTQRDNLMASPYTQAAKRAAVTQCPLGHPYDEQNTYVNRKGERSCMICRTAAQRRWYERKKAKRLAE